MKRGWCLKVIKIIIFAALIGILAVAAFAIPQGKNATMNLAFSIGQQASDDVLNASANFSSSHDLSSGTVVALVSAGKFENSTYNNSYSSNEKMISLTEAQDGTEFLIAITNGTSKEIYEKARQTSGGFISTAFRPASSYFVSSFPLYLAVIYDGINILNDTIFNGPEVLLIRNMGSDAAGRINITIEAEK